jgi:N-acetylneuraminic acid mutarotase
VLVAGGIDNVGNISNSAELYDPAVGSWSNTGSLQTARYGHSATLLPSGKVLVAGGFNDSGYLSSSQLYDPTTGNWSSTGSLIIARGGQRATLLPSGKVLVVGGADNSGTASRSAELYDPATGSWSSTGSPHGSYVGHTATLLPSGKVLVEAGFGAELYDPATGSWSTTGSLVPTLGFGHTATLLPSGKVLVAGGWSRCIINEFTFSTAELYDPATGSWSTTGSLHTTRANHTATLLPSGRVLVAGGFTESDCGGGINLLDTELYDPSSGTWSTTGSMLVPRAGHTATLLRDGKVLVAGGRNDNSAELYDPATGSWSSTGSLGAARNSRTTLLPSGKVLVAGGIDDDFNYLNSAELYDPGLGFDSAWQPLLTNVSPSAVSNGSGLTATGSRFRGISEASGGNGSQNSSSNYPLVQLLSLANEQTLFLSVDAMAGWSDSSFTSQPLTIMTVTSSGFPAGYALVTVFTNGIPSQSQFVLAAPSGECTLCHKHTQTLVLPCNSMEFRRHIDHGDSAGACPSGAGRKD